MGLFNKKNQELEGGIPALPELPTSGELSLPELPNLPNQGELALPELPELNNSLPEITLPKAPKLPPPGNIQLHSIPIPELKRTNQALQPEVIKQEITRPHQTMQKSQFDPDSPVIQKISSARVPVRAKPMIKDIEPVYVRLDKFETSIQVFEEIKQKIEQIEDLLKKTKDIKQKEEQELEEWEREIQLMKARIASVDKTVFDKLD